MSCLVASKRVSRDMCPEVWHVESPRIYKIRVNRNVSRDMTGIKRHDMCQETWHVSRHMCQETCVKETCVKRHDMFRHLLRSKHVSRDMCQETWHVWSPGVNISHLPIPLPSYSLPFLVCTLFLLLCGIQTMVYLVAGGADDQFRGQLGRYNLVCRLSVRLCVRRCRVSGCVRRWCVSGCVFAEVVCGCVGVLGCCILRT